jgi:hypothetical protein
MEKDREIPKVFYNSNLKIKGNTTYTILLIEAPIENTTMTKYLMYKNKVNNMEDKRLPKIASNSNENNDNIKNIITCTFKEKLWWDKELKNKRKLSDV